MNPAWKRVIAGSSIRTTLLRAALLAVITWLLFTQVLTVCRLDGASMEPTMKNRSVRIVNLLKYKKNDPARGDVVVISPAGRRVYYLKRILGLPGETVGFNAGQFTVNGQPQEEPYLTDRGDWNMEPAVLEADEYFVAGDNRAVPIERHLIGIVSREKIAGGLLW
ncbi:MAG: signal peptidase I [Kiritimatiellia bacterium]